MLDNEDRQDDQPVDHGEEVELTNEERTLMGFPEEHNEEVVTDDVEDEADEVDDDPTTDQVDDTARKLRIKYNGEEKDLTDEEAITLAQKGMNYDKLQERLNQQQEALDRTARMAGYKDHSEYIANLDKVEQQSLKQEQANLNAIEQNLIAELESAGLDPDAAREWLEQHPAIKAGREALQQKEQHSEVEKQRQLEEQQSKEWADLLVKYPDLSEKVVDGRAEWLTEDMQAKIQRGYTPIDAYEAVNRDKIFEQERKRAEQSAIKKRKLNARSQVEGNTKVSGQSKINEETLSAASIFGLDPKEVAKH